MADILGNIENLLKTAFGDFEQKLKSAIDPENIVNKMIEVDKLSSEMAKNFGVGRQNIDAIQKSLTDSYTNISLLGGSMKEIFDIQKDTSTALGVNVMQSDENVKSLYETHKVTGVEVSKMTSNFKDIGFSTVHISEQMQNVVDSARAIGVSATAVSGEVMKNMSKMNELNFANGVEGMAKMAAQAVNLRINMSDTLNIAKDLLNPEKAIEMAAAMQRLGVAQSDLLDPLRLMELGQNDPAELQNQIAEMSKQFVQLNKDGQFEIMPGAKRQLMEVEQALGYLPGQLSKMAISSFELQDKMNKIRFPKDAFDEDQKNFIANMAQMGKDGKYEIMLKGEKLGIDEAMQKFKDDKALLEQYMEDQKPKSIEELAREQLDTSKLIEGHLAAIENSVAYGTAGSGLNKGTMDFLRAGSGIMGEAMRSLIPGGKTSKQTTESIKKMGSSAGNVISGLQTGTIDLRGVLEEGEKLGKYFESITISNFKETISKAGEETAKLRDEFGLFDNIMSKLNEKYGKYIPDEFKSNKSLEPKGSQNPDLEIKNKESESGKKTETTQNNNVTITFNINGDGINEETIKKELQKTEIINTIKSELEKLKSDNGMGK